LLEAFYVAFMHKNALIMLTVIKSPTSLETFVTVVNEFPKSLSGISSETFKNMKRKLKN
jgi:hypothetical protein